jgi:hypothetical protein
MDRRVASADSLQRPRRSAGGRTDECPSKGKPCDIAIDLPAKNIGINGHWSLQSLRQQ